MDQEEEYKIAISECADMGSPRVNWNTNRKLCDEINYMCNDLRLTNVRLALAWQSARGGNFPHHTYAFCPNLNQCPAKYPVVFRECDIPDIESAMSCAREYLKQFAKDAKRYDAACKKMRSKLKHLCDVKQIKALAYKIEKFEWYASCTRSTYDKLSKSIACVEGIVCDMRNGRNVYEEDAEHGRL